MRLTHLKIKVLFLALFYFVPLKIYNRYCFNWKLGLGTVFLMPCKTGLMA